MKNAVNSFLLILGLFFTILVTYDVVLWWTVCTGSSGTFDEVKATYLEHYPVLFRNTTLLTLLSVAMGSAAGLCFVRVIHVGRDHGQLLWKLLAGYNSIFVFWHIFSLM
jgi:hypothetical protein